MVAWKILYGSFLTIPQGEGFMHWGAPQILSLLFSTNHGLITYTPIMLFCLIGLFLFKPGNRMNVILLAVFLTIFLIEFYLNSVADDWAGGWAFGARRLLSCSIIFSWGLANLISWLWDKTVWRNIAFAFFAFLIVFNLLFYYQWYLALIPRGDPLSWQQYLPGKIDALLTWFKTMGYLFSLVFS